MTRRINNKVKVLKEDLRYLHESIETIRYQASVFYTLTDDQEGQKRSALVFNLAGDMLELFETKLLKKIGEQDGQPPKGSSYPGV